MSFKTKIKIALLIILLLAGSYWYWWYDQTIKLRMEALQVVDDAESFTRIHSAIEVEFLRCQQFITQSEGDFGSFEYCTSFITWVNDNNLR